MWTRVLCAAALVALSLPCFASTLVFNWDISMGTIIDPPYPDYPYWISERFSGTRSLEVAAPGTFWTQLVSWRDLSLDVGATIYHRDTYSSQGAYYGVSLFLWASLTGPTSMNANWTPGYEGKLLTTFSDTITLHNGPAGDVILEASTGACCGGPPGYLTPRIPASVRFGEPFQLGVDLIHSDFYLAGTGPDAPAGIDFWIDSLRLFDSQGQPLSGYTYSSRLGHEYPFVGGTFVPVPEPALVSCVAFSLGGILAFAARRNKRTNVEANRPAP